MRADHGDNNWGRYITTLPRAFKFGVKGTVLPVVTIASGGNVTEGTAAHFTLTRTEDTAAALEVEVTVSETGEMVAAGEEGPRTVTFGAGSATAMLMVPTQDDSTDEPHSTVTVAIVDGDAYAPGTPATAEVVVADDDGGVVDDDALPVVTIASGGDVTEGTAAHFTLTRTGDTAAALAVEVTVSESEDMVAAGDKGPRTMTFDVGSATAMLTVPTRDDSADEPHSTVTVAVVDGDGYDLGMPSTAAVVVADDDALPVVTIASGGDVTEGTAASFTLTRTEDTAAALAVEVTVSETGDMVAAGEEGPRTVTFGAGSTTAMLMVPTEDDSADEPPSTVTVAIVDGDGYDLGMPSTAAVVVADDDEPAGPSVVAERTKALTYNLSSIGRVVTATAVSRIWDRAARLEPGGVRTSAMVGGRVIDAGAFAEDGGAQRLSRAVAGALGVADVGASGSAQDEAADFHAPDDGAGGYRDLKRGLLPDDRALMGQTRFELGLSEDSGAIGSLALWGRGAFTAFESTLEDDDFSDFSTEGEVFSGHVGIDYRASPQVLLGVAVGHSRGEASYAFAESEGGLDDMETELSSVHPYLYWRPGHGFQVWGTVGYGTGTATIEEGTGRMETDIALRTVGGGVRSEVSRFDELTVAVKADAFVTEVVADGVSDMLDKTEAESSRVRAAVEGVREWALEDEAVLSGALELGVRLDGGDAETGAGADLAGELRYASLRDGLEVALQGSALLAHEDSGFEEWGVGLLLVYDPGVSGRGMRLALSPAWNTPQSDVAESLWNAEPGSGGRDGTASGRGAALGVRLGYGMSALHGRALMTVYGEAGSDGDASRLRLGTELRPTGAGRLGLQVYGERQEREAGPEHALGLQLGLEFQ